MDSYTLKDLTEIAKGDLVEIPPAIVKSDDFDEWLDSLDLFDFKFNLKG